MKIVKKLGTFLLDLIDKGARSSSSGFDISNKLGSLVMILGSVLSLIGYFTTFLSDVTFINNVWVAPCFIIIVVLYAIRILTLKSSKREGGQTIYEYRFNQYFRNIAKLALVLSVIAIPKSVNDLIYINRSVPLTFDGILLDATSKLPIGDAELVLENAEGQKISFGQRMTDSLGGYWIIVTDKLPTIESRIRVIIDECPDGRVYLLGDLINQNMAKGNYNFTFKIFHTCQ